ncbi:efflux RND transporter periplasmic adaptor subunit [Litoreibacter roseus]|uniref:Hemolysin D n=1 Tax=Litoreibacter roseus TaxID=2601869 RepID=A0A6N6JEQ3_9RHOB|nr:efflux RND transporter periplasmic adaptor subunit [Litoreibacter roseus]GFE63778.1 hemolysin D [Litoreibacter roseus]
MTTQATKVGALAVFALAAALTLAFISEGRSQDDVSEEVLRAVKIVSPEAAEASLTRSFFGQVVALETVDLSFDVSGELVVFDAPEGQFVKKGEVLAQLDLAPFERSVERAELALAQSERELDRSTKLAQSNVASQVRAEDAQTARDLADVELRDAREALQDATIRAPFDGLIAERLTATFTNIAAGTPVLRVHDMSERRIEIDVPEQLLQQVGDPSRITFTADLPALPDPVPLELAEYQAQTQAVGQSFLVSLRMPDIDLPLLIPGASATVVAEVGSASDALMLEASALLASETRTPQVMLFEAHSDDRGVVRRHDVEVMSETGTGFLIKGLPKDAEVIAAGAHLLRDGQEVRRYTGLTVEE